MDKSIHSYEWIYPLWQLNQDSNQIFFYRWNDKRCANANNANLVNQIDSLLDNYSGVKKIKILSHSYGRMNGKEFLSF